MAITINEVRATSIAVADEQGPEYIRVFNADCTDVQVDTPKKVRDSPKVPRVGDKHPEDPQAVCRRVDVATRENDRLHWTITCEYSKPSRATRPSFRLFTRQQLVPAERDIFGNPILSSSGEPFVPAPTKEKSDIIVELRGRVPFAQQKLVTITSAKDTVNSDSLLSVFKPRTALITEIDGGIEIDDKSEPVLDIAIRFQIAESHLIELLDRGRYEIDDFTPLQSIGYGYDSGQLHGVPANRTPIFDESGQPVQNPVLLDGQGKKLAQSGKPRYMQYPKNLLRAHNQTLAALELPINLLDYARA